ncbi:hypothetical protein F5148DRAFT_1153738 [Russula earlei]|uniref:Uncharacterized protein n=1 Tax=Russula earlei TaxID=71964 RepID=A0ACC0TTW7_9AGAM|nr:hypothetical protein F5148DRAFT_1153738 [Russula earlei]
MWENKKLEWSVANVWIKNKNRNQDIFCTLAEMNPPEDESVLGHPIKLSHQASHICGHGAIYTKLFNWAKDPNTLFKFIWRLNSLTFAQHGYNTTVTLVSKNNKGVDAAQFTLVVYKCIKKVEVEDLHHILVNDDHATDGQPKPDITSTPIWEMKTLFGIEKEGDIYHDLQKAKVHYILKLGPAGDMLSTPEHPLDVQSTRTQDYVKDGDHKWYLVVLQLHPATQSHGLPDDLELFYWVLHNMVMKYQHSKFEVISQDMQDVFDGYRYMGCNHIAWGGLCELQEEKEPNEKTLEACKKLSSSKWVLTLIEGRLKSYKWPNDDGSLYKGFFSHDPTRSSCKHKAEDSNAAKEGVAFQLTRKAVQTNNL